MRRVVAFALLTLTPVAFSQDLRIKRPNEAAPSLGYGHVLPVGDSITAGAGFNGGWRRFLQEQLTREGVIYDFVGRRDSYAPMKFPFHEGHTGWTSKMVLEGNTGTAEGKLRDWLEKYKPNTIILMIGTNDTAPEPATQGLILNEIFTFNPATKVVVGLIPPVKGDPPTQAKTNEKRAAQLEAANRFKLQGYAVEVADVSLGFNPSTMLSDRIHPNEAGYRYMASVYRAALKRLWGF